jgi:hypothetical protein
VLADGNHGAREARLEAIARRFHERQLEDSPERIAELIHPEAEMALVVNDFRSVRGRDQIVAELSEARERMIYSAVVERCEKVDESTLLLRGQARYAVDRGLTHSTVCWLDIFRDELLWRVHAFRTEAQARAAYERFRSDGQAVQVRGTIQPDLAERGKDGGISATLADGDGNPEESGSGPSGRRALNEALFRRLNEEIERIEIDNGADASQPIDFICECSSATCMKVVSLSRAEYEAVRDGPSTFIVAPDHEEPAIEDVVVGYSEFSVVEKHGEAAAVAEETDPRD